jgi:hypothetical protein
MKAAEPAPVSQPDTNSLKPFDIDGAQKLLAE